MKPRARSSRFVSLRPLTLLPVLALATVLGCAPAEAPPADPGATAEDRPNVLVISLDTLRPDHLGVYGYERETSPALDTFAEGGVVFERAYAPAPSTVPSHATLFTGLLPSQHRTTTFRHRLADDALTLAERFREAGYRTFAASSSIRFIPESGFHQGFDTWQRFEDLPKNGRSRAVTDAALEQLGELKGSPEPFFGFLHYFGPHEPYAPPEPFRTKWHPGLPEPAPEDTSEYLQQHLFAHHDVPDEVLEYLVALYDGEILYLDQELGRLFDALDDLGLGQNTLTVILSDHGDGFRENGRLSHNVDLNEELLRIPLVFRWPAKLEPSRFEGGVGLVDVLPTVLKLVDLPAPTGLAGRSLAPRLLGEPSLDAVVDPHVVVGQIGERWFLAADLPEGRFKLEVFPDGSEKLFHLDEDRWGSRDVIAERPEAADALRNLASAYFAGPGRPFEDSPSEETPDVDPEVLEQLRAIGYVDEVDGGG